MDVVGLLLIAASLSLFLLPLGLIRQSQRGLHNPSMVCYMVLLQDSWEGANGERTRHRPLHQPVRRTWSGRLNSGLSRMPWALE